MTEMISPSSSQKLSIQMTVRKDDPRLVALRSDLSSCIAQLKPSPDWKVAIESMESLLLRIEVYREPLQKYQMDLLSNVLVPYLQKLKGRFFSAFTDSSRKKQVEQMLYILSLPDVQHPAEPLGLLDNVAHVIQREGQNKGHLFQSELFTLLDSYLLTAWRPIVQSTRSLLHSVASLLLGLGLVALIGWPLAVLYPLLSSTKQLTLIMKEMETRHSVSKESLFHLAKLAVVTAAALQMVRVLEAYASVGQASVAGSVLCFAVAQSDEAVKKLSLPLAPYVALMQREGGLSMEGVLALIQQGGRIGRSREDLDIGQTSPRVEIIDENVDSSQIGDNAKKNK